MSSDSAGGPQHQYDPFLVSVPCVPVSSTASYVALKCTHSYFITHKGNEYLHVECPEHAARKATMMLLSKETLTAS